MLRPVNAYRGLPGVIGAGAGALLSVPVNAAALEIGSAADGALAGLPGVLIASLALVFAIRERGRSKRLRLALEARPSAAPPAAATRAVDATRHSAIAQWQTDADGNTLYADDTMCRLLGVDDAEQIGPRSAAALLRPLSEKNASTDAATDAELSDGVYGAMLRPLDDDSARLVVVFERRAETDAGAIVSRIVIDSNALPRDLLDRHRKTLTAAA